MTRVIMFKNKKKLQEKNNKRVFFLGDSIVKHRMKYLKGYKISSHIENCKVYFKWFPVAKTRWIEYYTQSKTRGNQDSIMIHVGINDLGTTVELVLKLKINSCDLPVLNRVPRDDQFLRISSI